ncbi:MAG: hypothetical protein WA954_00915 [Parerythrobacter sp.]
MKNTDTRAGTALRDALTRALAAECGMIYGRTKDVAVMFTSLVNPTDGRFVKLATQSFHQRPHTIVSLWPECDTTTYQNLVVMYRHPLGAKLTPVDVASLDEDKTLVLVSGDRQTMFFLRKDGTMGQADCNPSLRIEQAIKRGMARLEAALAATRQPA